MTKPESEWVHCSRCKWAMPRSATTDMPDGKHVCIAQRSCAWRKGQKNPRERRTY